MIDLRPKNYEELQRDRQIGEADRKQKNLLLPLGLLVLLFLAYSFVYGM